MEVFQMAGSTHNRGQQGGSGMTRNGIRLTDREVDILRRSAQGDGSGKIARDLGIGKDRVKTLKQGIKRKIGLDQDSDTDRMVAQARRIGFIR
jgi:DNA-binding CsgD family transcriptional regulator